MKQLRFAENLVRKWEPRTRLVLGSVVFALIITTLLVLVAGNQSQKVSGYSIEEQRMFLLYAIDSYHETGNRDETLRTYRALEKGEELLIGLNTNPKDVDQRALDEFNRLIEEEAPLGLWWLCVGFVPALAGYAAVSAFRKRRRTKRPVAMTRTRQKPGKRARKEVSSSETVSSTSTPSPVAQLESTFSLGDNEYKEHFTVRGKDGSILAEIGIGIARVLREDSELRMPVAFDVWLFDAKALSHSTRILLSPWANGRKEIRDDLITKGELVTVKEKKSVEVISETLRLVLNLTDVEFGVGAPPPKSFYMKVVFALELWQVDRLSAVRTSSLAVETSDASTRPNP